MRDPSSRAGAAATLSSGLKNRDANAVVGRDANAERTTTSIPSSSRKSPRKGRVWRPRNRNGSPNEGKHSVTQHLAQEGEDGNQNNQTNTVVHFSTQHGADRDKVTRDELQRFQALHSAGMIEREELDHNTELYDYAANESIQHQQEAVEQVPQNDAVVNSQERGQRVADDAAAVVLPGAYAITPTFRAQSEPLEDENGNQGSTLDLETAGETEQESSPHHHVVTSAAVLHHEPIPAVEIVNTNNNSSDQEKEAEKRYERGIQRRFLLVGGVLLLVVVAAAVTVVLLLTQGGDVPSELPSASPIGANVTQAPSVPPSSVPTSSSLSTAQENFLALLPVLSPTTSFEDASSPQSKARDWLFVTLDENPQNRGSLESRMVQLFALATFFYATGGDTSWAAADRDTWLNVEANSSECDWEGLFCDDSGTLNQFVISPFVSISGTLPPELGLLTSLTFLIIAGPTRGTIPSQIGSLTNLVALVLGPSEMHGTIPTEVGLLTSLEQINLHGDTGLLLTARLTGTIPTELILLTKLKDLSLLGNDFGGTIPSEIGQLRDMTNLNLSYNTLSNLPTELGLLTGLTGLSLAHMQCNSTIPSELGQLTVLEGLFLNKNKLQGSIPSEAFAQLTKLSWLSLEANEDLTGTIPSSLCPAEGGTLSRANHDPSVTFDCLQ